MTSVVLAATDFSPASEHAIVVAAENARRGHAELHIVHVILPDVGSAGLEQAQRRLHELHAILAPRLAGAPTSKCHVRVGPFAESIVQLARALGAELIVVGTHGARRAPLGSVAEAVVRSAPCTVVVARPRQTD
jgi:nucleotide-binding universal stress UspA family protein